MPTESRRSRRLRIWPTVVDSLHKPSHVSFGSSARSVVLHSFMIRSVSVRRRRAVGRLLAAARGFGRWAACSESAVVRQSRLREERWSAVGTRQNGDITYCRDTSQGKTWMAVPAAARVPETPGRRAS